MSPKPAPVRGPAAAGRSDGSPAGKHDEQTSEKIETRIIDLGWSVAMASALGAEAS